ncbi:hypothetical protein AB3N61_18600 [Leptospira sp. WS58.C1]|uniref:hypothetical protein n=1 Tax=Leptospira cinconiae TaxID=3235173 RepID=UPI00349E589D
MEKEVIAAIITATGTLSSALVVGIAGALISKKYSKERDKQDKESQWRSHALELTKLDLQRKLSGKDKKESLRPSILDFLANYRNLMELDHLTPPELYQKIKDKRINKKK